ncbi:MAG TPA: hypothetical protein VFK05_39730 [Polyangiaceae bacterium]|nr:hypothetical protein [Polyangiaceae bacterium]
MERTFVRALGVGVGVAALAACALAACAPKVVDWGAYDVLTQRAPRPRSTLEGRAIDAQTYLEARRFGEAWFRETTFGDERTITDVLGLFGGSVEVPCSEPNAANGRCPKPVLPYVIQALDALDGQDKNLFQGNGGGYTADLVITFPPGTTLHGIPVPAHLHTGLDVEAGSPWPIGIVAKPAPAEDANLPYLLEPSLLDAGPAAPGKIRLGLTCATCHFSLDIDWDGKADLRSAWSNAPTPGSPYLPEHAWAIGNQDLRLGWVLALSKNPLLVFSVFSGTLGGRTADDARKFGRFVKANVERSTEAVLTEVVRGMAMQPRGFADDTPDALFNAIQFPVLYTRYNYPYNYDGNFINSQDRNNGVWTLALDPTNLVALCRDRAGELAHFGFGPKNIYNEFTASELADLMVRGSPAAIHDPQARTRLRDDILGRSDGVPGLLDPHSMLLVPGLPNAIPAAIRDHPNNLAERRNRTPASFGGDAQYRGAVLGYAGLRARTPPELERDPKISEWLERYDLPADELLSASVSLMLDSLDPPPNHSPLLRGANALVARGREVFDEAGCGSCHRGPFFTDNLVHALEEIHTQPARAEFGRAAQTFLAPSYDASTGTATKGGSRRVGYKTVTLRYVWGSAPYLHDGGVGVAVRSGVAPPASLAALLGLSERDKVYGTGPILAYRESQPDSYFRADAALSLQALVVRSERSRVIAGNRLAVLPVPGQGRALSGADLAIEGIGHEYYLENEAPCSERVTALIAFLLALDDDPGTL